MPNEALLVPPAPADVHAKVKTLKAVEFGLLRFLSVCAWDNADEDGWINFRKGRGEAHRPLIERINDDDREYMAHLEELGALEQPPNLKLYRIVRLTPTAWCILAYVSSARYNGDPGWRLRWQPWNDNRAEKPPKSTENRASTPARSDGSEK